MTERTKGIILLLSLAAIFFLLIFIYTPYITERSTYPDNINFISNLVTKTTGQEPT